MVEQNADAVRRIRAWKNKQIIHMPALVESDLWDAMPDKEEDGQALDCWDVDLQFPSSLDENRRLEYSSPALIDKEIKLRLAAARDSLAQIQLLLQKEWWLTGRKLKHVLGSGQKRNLKSNAAIRSLVAQRTAFVERYRRSWTALSRLYPEGQWKESLKRLRDKHVKMLADDEGKGEGRRTPSWIWGVKGSASFPEKEIYYGLIGFKAWYQASHSVYRYESRVRQISCKSFKVVGGSRFSKRRDEKSPSIF